MKEIARPRRLASGSLLALLLWVGAACAGIAEPRKASPDPLAGVEDLILAGRATEAKAAAQEAQRIFRLRGNRRGEALCLLVRGAAEITAKDFSAAAIDFQQSATTLATTGDRYSAWMALWHVGALERALGKSDAALLHLRQALSLLREIETSSEPFSAAGLTYLGRYLQMPPDLLRLLATRPAAAKPVLLQIAEAMTRRAALDVFLDTSRLDEAEAELSRLDELSRQLDGMFGEEARLYRGTLRRLQWRLDEAREIFHQSLARKTPLPPAQELEILASLIELEMASGRFDEALALNDRALALARRRNNPGEVSKLLLFRAHVLRNSGRTDAAAEALAQAMDLAQKSGQAFEQALVHQQLGYLTLDQGRPEQAAVHFEAAARLFHAAGRPDHEAHTRIQLSQIYAQLNSRGSAGEELERARALNQGSASQPLQTMTELLAAIERYNSGTGTLAEVEKNLLALLALPQTKETHSEADRQWLAGVLANFFHVLAGTDPPSPDKRAVPDKGADRPALRGVDSLILGFMHYQRGEFTAARDLWLAALAEAPRREFEIFLLAFIGYSYEKEQKPEEAIGYLRRAVAAVEETVEDLRLEDFLAGYLGNEQVLFSDLIDLLVQEGQPLDAFDYAEQARARAFLQNLGNPRLEPGKGADPQLVREAEGLRRQLLDQERRALSALPGEEKRLEAELRQVRERYQALLMRLKVTDLSHASRARVAPQQVQAIRRELPSDTTLISYFVSSLRVHAWVLDQETFRYVTLPLAPQDLRGAVCWADELGRRSGGRGVTPLDPQCGGAAARAEELYEKLIAPLRGDIHHRRLIVVPHGELNYLPFAALRNPRTHRYLLEDYTLTYAPSASVLGFLRARETPVEGKALVLGEPAEADPRLGPLPAARREAERVGWLLGTRPLLGAKATEGRLDELAGTVDLLHIAAHGVYEPRSPLFSRIALAPDSDHDGNLEVHEISLDLDLSGVNLVVLSACGTSRGERSRGDEITSLTRAFLVAGSPGVISTLWDIDDEAAAVLMEELYRHLLAGASVADALRQAQLSLLHSGYRDPAFWAAFSLTGDPQGRWR